MIGLVCRSPARSFLVGAAYNDVAPATGELYLGINDVYVPDNSGNSRSRFASRRRNLISTGIGARAGGATVSSGSQLAGQTVVVIGGSSGMGLETARLARAEGADVIITGRSPERLEQAARDVDAHRTAAFDANDADALEQFFAGLTDPVDHVLVTAGGPFYGRAVDLDLVAAHRALGDHLLLPVRVGRHAIGRVRAGGTLLFISGTGGRKPAIGTSITSAITVGVPAIAATLALELAPIRVNVIAPGFVDTSLSAAVLGDGLDERRSELRSTLPIGRVVGPADVAALAVHIMANTALTGATYDIDGGQQLL